MKNFSSNLYLSVKRFLRWVYRLCVYIYSLPRVKVISSSYTFKFGFTIRWCIGCVTKFTLSSLMFTTVSKLRLPWDLEDHLLLLTIIGDYRLCLYEILDRKDDDSYMGCLFTYTYGFTVINIIGVWSSLSYRWLSSCLVFVGFQVVVILLVELRISTSFLLTWMSRSVVIST